jgi:hypothetical protein
MKPFFFRLSIALLTFLIGFWITTSFSLLFTQIPEVEVITDKEKIFAYPFLPDNGIEILYDWKSMKWNKRKGRFLITNRTNQSISYLAYEKTQHFDNWIRQNGKVKGATDFICHMGMELQELKPNESQLFEINIPRNKKPFEAGFEFYVGEEQEAKTFWVEVNKESNYNLQMK